MKIATGLKIIALNIALQKNLDGKRNKRRETTNLKIARFSVRSMPSLPRLGVLRGQDHIIDVTASYRVNLIVNANCRREKAWRLAEAILPNELSALLDNGQLGQDALKEAVEFAEQVDPDQLDRLGEKVIYPLSAVLLHAPIRPRLIRDFISFEDHIRNSRRLSGQDVPPAWYEFPTYYKGNPESVIGPEEEVVWPSYTDQMDYELELACIIGREGRDIPATEAEQFIFGYTVMNDFSARDFQAKEMSIGLGPAKGKDFATALGPWVVTPDEIGDVYNLAMTARVNGELWSEGNTSSIHWTFGEMIQHASRSETLIPGDLIGSGTVGLGCGKELGRYLQPGDTVELEIQNIGVLKNRIGPRPAL